MTKKRKYATGSSKLKKKLEALRSKDDGKWAEAFEAAGDPDLSNPETDLDYTRKLQLIVLRQMATTPAPSLRQQECWRRIQEMSKAVGMTANRASLEATVRRLKSELADKQQPTAVKVVDGTLVTRSPNARGERRGPRPLPDPDLKSS